MTIAEVGVAFGGFAGLVTVLARRVGSGAAPDAEVHLLYSMLLLSMLTVAFALVPRLPLRFGASEAESWRISSGAFFVAWLGYYLPAVRRIMVSIDPAKMPGGLPLIIVNQGVHLAAGLGLITAALGMWGAATPGVYLSALFAMLYLAGVLFVILFMLLVRR